MEEEGRYEEGQELHLDLWGPKESEEKYFSKETEEVWPER